METDRIRDLSSSSRRALGWAVSRARKRAMSEKGASGLVTTADLLAGILLAHPNRSEPQQLLEHFHVRLEYLYEALRATGGFAPDDDDVPSEPEHLQGMPEIDKQTDIVFSKSFELKEHYNPEKESLVRLRDLFGGILLTSNEARDLLLQCLSAASVAFDDLTTAYPDFLRYPSEKMSYAQFLAERFPLKPGPIPPAAIRFAVSGFSADTRTEQDLVGIGAEVDAFAYLISAKALQPPLAIGLFGDWGSGKTFFMEALRERIHKITADAKESGRPQKDISIYKHIAQIEFNAWHYVEGELWASIVEHIFRNLQTRSKEKLTLLQERQQHWIEKLEGARRKERAAQTRKATLEVELDQKREHITTLEREREETLKRLAEVRAKDVLDAVELSDEEQERITKTLADLGVTETYQSAAELMAGVQELRTVLQQGNALTTPLRERGWKWVLALIVVILAGPAVSIALNPIGEIPAVTNALASVSAFLSGLAVVLKQGTAWLSGAITRVDQAQFQLEAKQREVEEQYAQELAEAERQYAAKAEEYETAKREEQTLEQEIVGLEQELQRVTPGRILLDFVNERVGSQDYRQHLGIAALIRRDFEQLSQLIAEQNQSFIKTDDGSKKEEHKYLINRIVLYIDDLDRCPPERVVKVLQAVHLLLAFPLFVVVLAVDARWLAQSLEKHYQDLLVATRGREDLRLSERFAQQATPQDYLEKIFQVPFWVNQISEKARIRIVKGLVAESLVRPSLESSTGKPGQADEDNGKDGGRVETSRKEEKLTIHWEASEQRRPLQLKAETDLKPESLDIHDLELGFMEDLRTILGETPRSVKRFVNVYRLIKAVSLNQAGHFVEDSPHADFKLVLFLLAVLTGLPAISREFFQLLREKEPELGQAPGAGQHLPEPTGPTLKQVIEGLGLHGFVSREASGRDQREEKNGYENWEAARDLQQLDTWVQQYDEGSWLSMDTTKLAAWAPLVSRFSYRDEEL
jgi:hypothetical protein